MRLTGAIDIAAPVGAVWSVVVDPTDLAACIPGVGEIRQPEPGTFEGTIRAAVGPIDGHFSFRAVLEDIVEPRSLTVRVEGTDSMTKSRLLADVAATLETTPTGTTLGYTATITTKGRLAIIGDMVLRATAGMLIGQATRCLRDRLERDGSA